MAIAIAVVSVAVRESRGGGERRLDLAGIGLAACPLAFVTFALIEAGRRGLTTEVILAAIAALVAAFAFVLVESGQRTRCFRSRCSVVPGSQPPTPSPES